MQIILKFSSWFQALLFSHFLIQSSVTTLLTLWSSILLEKLSGSQLDKKIPAFYGTRRFNITFTSALHLFVSWARSIQPMPPHPTSSRSILILSPHLCLGLPNGLFPLGLPHQNPIYTSALPHKCHMPYPSHSSRFGHPNNLGEEYRSIKSSCSFLYSPVASSLLGPNVLLSILFSKTLSLPQCERPSFTPIKQQAKL